MSHNSHIEVAKFRAAQQRPFRIAAVFALIVAGVGPSLDAAPVVGLTKVGSPIWKPVDFHLFSAPATPFTETFGHVYQTLLPYDNPLAPTYTPHAPPYATELSAGALAGGYVSRSVFPASAITLDPNGVYFAFMLVPDPGTTGSSRDFASGPVIPNSLFPLASNIDAWLDGILVDRLLGADALIQVQPKDAAFQGTSHLESLQVIWHPWDDDLTAPAVGNYDLRMSLRDSGGFGWDIVAPFQVVPNPDGDFNRDGYVDGADFVVWRNGLSTGAYTQNDYTLWRTHFGQSIYTGSSAQSAGSTIPEPTGIALLLVSTLAGVMLRGRRSRALTQHLRRSIGQQNQYGRFVNAGKAIVQQLTHPINRVRSYKSSIARLITSMVVIGGAMNARGQTNPYQPTPGEIQSMFDVTQQFSNYSQASSAVYSNILGGKQLDITYSRGTPTVNEEFTRIATSQEFPGNNGDGDGGDLEAFDGLAWRFLSDLPITVKPFSQSYNNYNFQEGSQPSTGCGIGCICVPANTPTTVWIDWDVVTSSFPISDRANVFRIGFQIFGPDPPQDGTTVHSTLSITSMIPVAPHNIFQWEYINPNDPGQGKKQGVAIPPGGGGLQALPGLNAASKNLTMAYLIDADLTGANFNLANLSNAALSHANLTNVDFSDANLNYADFTGAGIHGAKFGRTTSPNTIGSGISAAQLASTANFGAHDLTGIDFHGNDLGYADLSGQNLTSVNLESASLYFANFSNTDLSSTAFSGADVRYARFTSSNLAPAQLYQTSSYVSGNLDGIELAGFNLTGANFAGKSLPDANLSSATLQQASFANASLGKAKFTNADLSNANLSGAVMATSFHEGADFTGANFTGANFSGANVKYAKLTKSNITPAQLQSTASYQQGNLEGIELVGANLAGAQFAGKAFANANFSSANFTQANLANTTFSAANLTRADLDQATLTNANLTGANLTGASLNQTVLSDAIIKMAKLSSTHITLSQLYSTASYKNHDLKGVYMYGNDLSGANLTGQELSGSDFYAAKLVGANFTNSTLMMAELINADLTGANLTGTSFVDGSLALANLTNANLTNANLSGTNLIGTTFTGANIRGATLGRIITTVYSAPSYCKYCCGYAYNPGTQTYVSGTGITLGQLSSTANYVARDLSNVVLTNNDFTGGNFADFNLANSSFTGTPFTSANLMRADARGAIGLDLSNALVTNLVRPNGHISGLNLGATQVLSVRDFDGAKYSSNALVPITVDNQFAIAAGGSLRMLFEADAWNSTISFAPGISVARGGTLDLQFASGTSLTNQIGRTFSIFNWSGVTPTGSFAAASPYTWDLSKLYTTGEVTLLATSGAPGDFNNDGRVDTADYVVWRKGFGSTYTQAAYNVWRTFYDLPIGSGSMRGDASQSAVPEPKVPILVLVVLLTSMCHRPATTATFRHR